MEQPMNSPRPIKCLYCRYEFVPDPVVTKAGKKKRTYIECPRCGNGFEREFRWYDRPRKTALVHG